MHLLAKMFSLDTEEGLSNAINQLTNYQPAAERALADMGEYLDQAADCPEEAASLRYERVLSACQRFITAHVTHPGVALMSECCWTFHDIYNEALVAQEEVEFDAEWSDTCASPSMKQAFDGAEYKKTCGEVPQVFEINQLQQAQELAVSL